ncbi:cilia- and flagella-associated protein 119 [Sparus aurata]|uniref:Cilia and flagella associated protein 119 n=1 Tax=Sparus aurata TaxID=8175 RepID=A0A671W6Y8_SPAAU|nr:coiled-coil domain-containing protein 189 [Sparus aurata]XP_030255201.1 coiled-coil domain-containing protein 189 [Sparus aurata]XP_030255202.1 coiled-coil domain-containing protein 189 [Sparus aurata]
MDTRIKVPQALKAKVMLWTDVGYHDMEEIDKMQSIPDLESVLCSVFGVDLPEPKRGVLLELYVQAVLFCRERNFKKEQTSALLSIIKSIHEANVETPLNNIEQSFKYCKELLLCHSVRRPPFSINLFSSEEVTGILNYIFNSYVRHYKLYKYIFTPQVKLDLSLTYSGTPNQEEATIEDSSALDVENVKETEGEAAPKTDSSLQTQEAFVAEPEEDTPGSKSGLKALIENEVREQMMLVSGQLDQRMKEIADQHNRALESPQLNHKAKK